MSMMQASNTTPALSVRQIASINECAIVIVENGVSKTSLKKVVQAVSSFKGPAVLRLRCNGKPPWLMESFQASFSNNTRRQMVVAGDVVQPCVVALCLFSLEEGYQTFCIDINISDDSAVRRINLDRLAHCGVALLSLDQFIAEVSFGLQ